MPDHLAMKARTRWLAQSLIAALWLAAGCSSLPVGQATPTPLPIVADISGTRAEGRLEPARYVELSPAVGGLVSEVLVSEGDYVQAGQLIARLDSANAQTLEAARTNAALDLSSAFEAARIAQSELDDYPLPRIFVGLSAEQAARSWLAELDSARKAFAPFKETSRKGLRAAHAFSNAVYPSLPHRTLYDTQDYDDMAMVYKKRVDVAWMNYTKAVLWLNLDAALATARARVAEAQRRFDVLQDEAQSSADAGVRSAWATAEIRTPLAGTVTRLDLKLGEVATAGVTVVTVADLSQWIVRTTDLTEIDVPILHEGMPVKVILDSNPELTLNGKVMSIDLGYAERQGEILYPVRISLTDNLPDMRWGMTAEATFVE